MKLSGISALARSRLPLYRLCKSDRKLLLTSLVVNVLIQIELITCKYFGNKRRDGAVYK